MLITIKLSVIAARLAKGVRFVLTLPFRRHLVDPLTPAWPRAAAAPIGAG